MSRVLSKTRRAGDEKVLRRAHEENRTVLTFDRDYGELIYRYKSSVPAGVLYFRFAPATPDEPAQVLLAILEEGKVVIPGKFTVVERGRIRQRALSAE